MSAKHHLRVSARIPPSIPPSTVIAALHDHNTALSLQALTTGHKNLSSPAAPETLQDPYWLQPIDTNPVESYEVKECIFALPGAGEWGRWCITFPACFQNTQDGIKSRADASGGVVVRGDFRVVEERILDERDRDGDGDEQRPGRNGWVLVEDIEVTCSWWLMPFVKSKMEQAHRELVHKIIEKVVAEQKT